MAQDDLNNLKPMPGSKHRRIRFGRGNASGNGTTAGRGQKGQKSRSGGNIPAWFEGGQMPLQRRLPKVGFTSRFDRSNRAIVNLRDLDGLGDTINLDVLKAAGRVGNRIEILKILGDGELTKALTVQAHSFSKAAKAAIEAAGGTAEEIN